MYEFTVLGLKFGFPISCTVIGHVSVLMCKMHSLVCYVLHFQTVVCIVCPQSCLLLLFYCWWLPATTWQITWSMQNTWFCWTIIAILMWQSFHVIKLTGSSSMQWFGEQHPLESCLQLPASWLLQHLELLLQHPKVLCLCLPPMSPRGIPGIWPATDVSLPWEPHDMQQLTSFFPSLWVQSWPQLGFQMRPQLLLITIPWGLLVSQFCWQELQGLQPCAHL